jgi:hypothetical protein
MPSDDGRTLYDRQEAEWLTRAAAGALASMRDS